MLLEALDNNVRDGILSVTTDLCDINVLLKKQTILAKEEQRGRFCS